MTTTRTMTWASVCGLATAAGVVAQPINESFDVVGSLSGAGWFSRNNSSPAGPVSWFQGNPSMFAAQASAGYLAVDYRSVDTLGTISNWQIMPSRTLNNGDVLRFWTRTVSPAAYADRLQVRLSTAGPSTEVGTLPTDVGDFSTLLLDLNPNYFLEGTGSYPATWTPFTITLSDLPGPIQGRLAFRYYVEHGGSSGSHSDYIGIDSLEYAPGGLQLGRCCIPGSGLCVVETAAGCAAQAGVFAGVGTACTGFSCPQPATGACCTATGSCTILTTAACASAGGIYRGDNTGCATAACPTSFAYIGTPIGIQDGFGSAGCGPVATSVISVAANFPISKAEVAFAIQHPWQGDLKISLVKLGGPAADLIDRPGVPATTYGFSAHDFGAPTGPGYFRISDTAASIYDAPAVFAPGIGQPVGSWKSEGPLSVFNGLASAGDWELRVTDCAGGEYGTINAFILILTPQSGPASCYANCDGSTTAPVLTANDFQCFLNHVATQDPSANCDESTTPPLFTANDFQCFLNKFAAGCS